MNYNYFIDNLMWIIRGVACDTVHDTINDTVNISSNNIYIDNSDAIYDSVSDNSKKDNLNTKLNNKDLYVHVINYLNCFCK